MDIACDVNTLFAPGEPQRAWGTGFRAKAWNALHVAGIGPPVHRLRCDGFAALALHCLLDSSSPRLLYTFNAF
jgi:hypothetical protein